MPINHNKFSVVDFETGGIGEFKQPLSIGIVIIDARRLIIADNGLFYSKIRPCDPDKCEIMGLDPIDPKALAVNKLTLEELSKSPTPKAVWENVINFMKYHNIKGDKWSAPIFTGWNTGFDYSIVNRLISGNIPSKLTLDSKIITKKDQKDMSNDDLAKAYKNLKFMKEPYKFGGETLFRPFPVIDVAQAAFMMFESLRSPEKLSLDAVKAFLGFEEGEDHNALVDCLWTAEIWVRYLNLFPQIAPEVDYETEGKTILNIEAALSTINFAPKQSTINNSSTSNSPIKDEKLEECPF